MAHKVQAYATYGPRLEPATPMTGEEAIEDLVNGTNQSRGSTRANLTDQAVQDQCKASLSHRLSRSSLEYLQDILKSLQGILDSLEDISQCLQDFSLFTRLDQRI